MDNEGRLNYINTKGETIGEGCWTSASPFKRGVAVVQDKEGRHALIDQSGRAVIPYLEGVVEILAGHQVRAHKHDGSELFHTRTSVNHQSRAK